MSSQLSFRKGVRGLVVRQLLCVFAAFGCVWAQGVSTGDLHGTIFDPSGAVVPLAEVTVSHAETGVDRIVSTNQTGRYWVLRLPPGRYDVQAVAEGFVPQRKTNIQVQVGNITAVDFELEIGLRFEVEVAEYLPTIETERTHQANTVDESYIRRLPIDRRDYLSYTLLAPGVVDSKALADGTDFRVPQTPDTGLSFYGSNGRGNSVTIDGGEANDFTGGVRETLSQEAVQEFQINRGSYSAELGGASGAVINIVSKSGTNELHGSAFGFFRHGKMDAGDPFAKDLIDGAARRVDPPSHRQQFGGTFGGPLRRDRSFFFLSFEGLERDESNSVAVLTDLSIFEPTPAQEEILAAVPQGPSQQLRAALTSPSSTRQLFEENSGVFPFRTSDYKASVRLDHRLSERNSFLFRHNYANGSESNPNTRALVGVSRGVNVDTLDSNSLLSWTHIHSPRVVNEARVQFNYRNFLVNTLEPFGPEININGFGFFNRDAVLPSNNITRRYELSDTLNLVAGKHRLKLGGIVLIRGNHADVHAFLGGRFTFGGLPGGLVNPALASTTITALQAFNLGLPQAYQQGFGDPIVKSTIPFYAGFIHDSWQLSRNLTLDLGLRYEFDDRTDPVPSDTNNFGPRFGFAWDPWNDGRTAVRGGYGIFYSPSFYFVDFVTNALNVIDGFRPIAQVLTTIQTPGAASAANIYRTLAGQGAITFPFPSRSITPNDLAQFGIEISHSGPIPPLSVLFRNSEDYVNAYAQQASFGIDRDLGHGWTVGVSYLFARTLKITRAREDNLLEAPINPALGIRVWSPPFFKQPLLFQDNVYESTARAFYHGFIVETTRRFGNHFSLHFNYTLSKAIDEVVDFNSDFQANDQLDLRAERSLSSFDQRHKLVAYGVFETPSRPGHRSWAAAFADITLTPVLRANSARPFNLLVGSDLNGDRHSTTDRPAFAGRNTGVGPDFWTVDVRLTKTLSLGEARRLEVIAEAFNLLNRLNFRSVNNTVGNMAGPFRVYGRHDRGPSEPLGFTSAFEPRRIQLGLRFRF